MFTLVIGNKNYSSWSLRPWLVLKMLNEPFEEQRINLRTPDTAARIKAISPAGKVPILYDKNIKVWDSLAICEYLAECFPHAKLWPDQMQERARARSLTAEMHAGFSTLRASMPMDICGRHPTPAMTPELEQEIRRIIAIWEKPYPLVADGAFLFGRFSIVDAFFAPVVTRFVSYQISLPEKAQAYANHILSLPPMLDWISSAEQEKG